jgi:uncharacterized membrane protein YkgB
MTTTPDPLGPPCPPPPTSALIGEVQVILAEKRTSLAVLRTGIAVFVLPLSVLSVLITTSKYYTISQVLPFLLPLLILCGLLVILGAYLVARAILKLRHYDRMIGMLKRKHGQLKEFVD